MHSAIFIMRRETTIENYCVYGKNLKNPSRTLLSIRGKKSQNIILKYRRACNMAIKNNDQ